MAALRWEDRVYGDSAIDDPAVLALIDTPTFRRLGGIKQAGPSALAFPFKTVTRFEHSLGVYLLLKKLDAGPKELVAGLLHDISHTAFSHAVDFVFASEAQDHHEGLKPEFLNRADLARALGGLGYRPEDFYHDAIYPMLEQPLPALCADRLDYFFRDSLTCGVSTPAQVAADVAALVLAGPVIAFNDEAIARGVAERFAAMNRDWWASPTEAYIYNEFADALREAFRLGVLRKADLLADDARVLDKLRSAKGGKIREKLQGVLRFQPGAARDYRPRVEPKSRWLDPLILDDRGLSKLSERG